MQKAFEKLKALIFSRSSPIWANWVRFLTVHGYVINEIFVNFLFPCSMSSLSVFFSSYSYFRTSGSLLPPTRPMSLTVQVLYGKDSLLQPLTG